MKERYIVGTISKNKPELESVYWTDNKKLAIEQAQLRRKEWPKEETIFAKILNIPSEAQPCKQQ